MSFERSSVLLGHIAHAIQAIESFTTGMDFEDFRADPKTVAAVERMPLTISGAAKRMGPDVEMLCPGQKWHQIRGMGNWLRHQGRRLARSCPQENLGVTKTRVKLDRPPSMPLSAWIRFHGITAPRA